jgi:hypothetical protein
VVAKHQGVEGHKQEHQGGDDGREVPVCSKHGQDSRQQGSSRQRGLPTARPVEDCVLKASREPSPY